jgi:hypothetical protein
MFIKVKDEVKNHDLKAKVPVGRGVANAGGIPL